MIVVPVSHSTASGAKKKNSRRVSNDISPLPKGRGTIVPTNVRPDLSQMLDAMNNSNHSLFSHSFSEVVQDQDDVMKSLTLASQANDTRS